MRRQPSLFEPVPDRVTLPISGVTPETRAASTAAALEAEGAAATVRAAVLAYIRGCELGATDDDIQAALRLSGNTERPRRWELLRARQIEPAGLRRNGRRRWCTVWRAVA